MKISIAMTTYNCEKYVIDQIESIYNQSRLPNEVIICDDGSTDKTVSMVLEFIESRNLTNSWKIIKNPVNKGCTRNFVECALKTTGDIVLYSDHDDIWHVDKIKKIEGVFLNNSDAILVAHRYESVKEDGITPTASDDRYFKNDNSIVKVSFRQAIHNMSIGGAVFGVKKSLIEECAFLSLDKGMSHDLPVSCMAAAKNGLYFINIPLMYRRIHALNLSSPTSGHPFKELRHGVQAKIQSRSYLCEFFNQMFVYTKNIVSKEESWELNDASESMRVRAEAIKNRQFFKVLKYMFSKNKMIDKTRVMIDLYCIIFGEY